MKPVLDLEHNISFLFSIHNLERKKKTKKKKKHKKTPKTNKASTSLFISVMSLWKNLGLNPGLVIY